MQLVLVDGSSVPGRESPGSAHQTETRVGRVGAPCRRAGRDPTRSTRGTGLLSLQTASRGHVPCRSPSGRPCPVGWGRAGWPACLSTQSRWPRAGGPRPFTGNEAHGQRSSVAWPRSRMQAWRKTRIQSFLVALFLVWCLSVPAPARQPRSPEPRVRVFPASITGLPYTPSPSERFSVNRLLPLLHFALHLDGKVPAELKSAGSQHLG